MATGFLTDPKGKLSSMRLMSVFSLGIAALLAVLDVLDKGEIESTIILYFLLGAFAPKALQSFAEHKGGTT